MKLREGPQRRHAREIDLSHLDKVLFPDSGITKGELVSYYDRIAATMLPYLVGRPVVLGRHPDGIGASGFYQRNASRHFPPWLGRATVDKRGGGTTDAVVIDEPAALVYLAGQGTIEFHGWLARADRPGRADQIVFDLDPPGDDVDAARGAARRVRDVLEELELPHLLKTSGSKGYHVHVLIDRESGVHVPRFAADVARLMATRHPEELTDEQRKAARGGRVLVDHFRNGYGQTVVAPYAVRARPGAPVSTPIEWRELGRTHPRRFTIRNVLRRLGQRQDAWAEAWTRAIPAGTALADARGRLDTLLRDVRARR